MRVTTGNLEVLESGTVDSLGMHDVDCLLTEQPPLWTTFRVQRSEEGTPGIAWQQIAPERLVITMTNPRHNAGPKSPLQIGRIHQRPLFISFRINVLGDYNSFQVAYTFYLGGAVA